MEMHRVIYELAYEQQAVFRGMNKQFEEWPLSRRRRDEVKIGMAEWLPERTAAVAFVLLFFRLSLCCP